MRKEDGQLAKQNITFSTKFTDIKAINPEFSMAKCWVCAIGKNANYSYIGKEATEKALDSLWNIPVVGHLFVDADGNYRVGGHDSELGRDEKGDLCFKDLTVPFGVVPYMPEEVKYEEVTEADGEVKTYITCPVILWSGRYPQVMESINKDDNAWSQSMEITVDAAQPYEEDPNYLDILEYNYSALCLLGRYDDEYNVQPCFPEAKVVLSEFSLENDKFAELFAQLKQELATCFSQNPAEETKEEESISEVTETDTASIETPEVADEDNSASDESENESNEEIAPETAQEMTEESSENAEAQLALEVQEQNSQFHTAVDRAKNYTSENEKYAALCKLYPSFMNTDDVGIIISEYEYYIHDYTEEYVYVIEHIYDWADGDVAYTERLFRQAYVYDPETDVATKNGPEEECVAVWLTIPEKEEIEAMRDEYDTLVKYQADKEEAERKQKVDEAIADFEDDLAGNAEFELIYANRYSYADIEALKNACYIVKGKYGVFSQEKTVITHEPIIPIGGSTKTPMTAREKLHAQFGQN